MHSLIDRLKSRKQQQQFGINMVDLMMWLVIAALLLAAAIQGIGYYQKAAYLYQMQSDLEGAGTVTTGLAANNDGVIDKATADRGVAEAKRSTDVTTTVEIAADGKTPYLRGVHPAVVDKDVLYLFDACKDTYKIGVNVVPKGGTPALESCGISASPPTDGSGGGGTTTPTPDDIDGDGLPNTSDPDIDGDNIPNASDPTPNGESGSNGGGGNPPAGGSFALAGFGASNNYGQLGTANNADGEFYSSKIIDTNGLTFSTIDAGNAHTCGISDGKAYCWGSNGSGQVGIGSYDNVSTPTLVGGLLTGKTVTEISAGPSHSCAISNSEVYCWGANNNGQANGVVDEENRVYAVTAPVLVNNGALAGVALKSVDADGARTCVVDVAGKAYCWGDDQALGDGAPRGGDNYSEPVAVAGNLTFTSKITGFWGHACGISGGDVYCWGSNDYGRVGNGTADRSFTATPTKVLGLPAGKAVTSVTAGDSHTCAITEGKAYCWGANWGGQVGNGSTEGYDTPSSFTAVPVNTSGVLSGVSLTIISAYNDLTCATGGSGVYCWGEGMAGDGNTDGWGDYYSPVAATGDIAGKAIKVISSGNYYTAMLIQ